MTEWLNGNEPNWTCPLEHRERSWRLNEACFLPTGNERQRKGLYQRVPRALSFSRTPHSPGFSVTHWPFFFRALCWFFLVSLTCNPEWPRVLLGPLLKLQLLPGWSDLMALNTSCCCSVPQLCLTLCDLVNCSTPGLPVHHQLLEFTQTYVHRQWCHPTISSSVIRFSCPHSLPASRSFPVSRLLTSGGQSIGASASVLPMNIHSWFPLGWTGLISLLSKGHSKIFSSTRIQRHQFFGAQPSLWSNSHIHIWLLGKNIALLYRPLSAKWYICLSLL